MNRAILPLLFLAGCNSTQPEEDVAVRAAVYEFLDPYTNAHGTAFALDRAGFSVAPLDSTLAFDPTVDLFVLGSLVSEDPRYSDWIDTHRSEILRFVENGGVLLVMTQRQETESEIPFLHDEYATWRAKDVNERAYIRDEDHGLVSSFSRRSHNGVFEAYVPYVEETGAGWPLWSPLRAGPAFRRLLFSQRTKKWDALAEAQMGRGRVVLTALWFDKRIGADGSPLGTPEYATVSDGFFGNLKRYVQDVRSGALDDVEPNEVPRLPEPIPPAPGSWTLVVLPDTQGYAANRPDHLHAQTRWIAENADALDIRMVMQVGDLTENNTPEEWAVVDEAFRHLDGRVPYAVTTGNHDHGPGGGAQNRDSNFITIFTRDRLDAIATFREAYPEAPENAVHTFEANGDAWLVLMLEWGPRPSIVRWARDVLDRYPGRRVILATHSYLQDDDTRQGQNGTRDVNNPHSYGTGRSEEGTLDGEELWQQLVSKAGSIDLVLCGHTLGDGLAKVTSQDVTGHAVHQLLANFQHRGEYGASTLRLLEFQPDGQTVRVKTFLPAKDSWLTDWENQFELRLDRPNLSN